VDELLPFFVTSIHPITLLNKSGKVLLVSDKNLDF